MICVRCGARERYQEALCKTCYIHLHPELEKEVTLRLCVKCDAVKVGNVWKHAQNLQQGIHTAIKYTLHTKEITLPPLAHTKTVRINAKTNGEEIRILLHFQKELCPTCSRKTSGYYETILQIRNLTKNQQKNLFNHIKTMQYPLSKKEKISSGFDLYFVNRNEAVHLCTYLKNMYPGVVKTSAKLFSYDRQTSKNLFRDTVLFKRFPYNIGETLVYRGEKMRVIALGHTATLQEESGKKSVFTFTHLDKWDVF